MTHSPGSGSLVKQKPLRWSLKDDYMNKSGALSCATTGTELVQPSHLTRNCLIFSLTEIRVRATWFHRHEKLLHRQTMHHTWSPLHNAESRLEENQLVETRPHCKSPFTTTRRQAISTDILILKSEHVCVSICLATVWSAYGCVHIHHIAVKQQNYMVW